MHQHFDRIHNGKRFHCKFCDKNLSSAFRLRTHMETKHHVQGEINFKSTIVTVKGNDYEIAPEAKSELILVQQKEIKKYQEQIAQAHKRYDHLKKQLKSK